MPIDERDEEQIVLIFNEVARNQQHTVTKLKFRPEAQSKDIGEAPQAHQIGHQIKDERFSEDDFAKGILDAVTIVMNHHARDNLSLLWHTPVPK